MKNPVIPAFVALIAAASTPAWAWSQVSGEIKSIDQNSRQLVLTDGEAFALQPNVDMSNLRTGDKVTLTAEASGGRHVVKDVQKAG